MVWRRDKQGFHAPAGTWVLNAADAFHEYVADCRAVIDIVDFDAVFATYESCRHSQKGAPQALNILWRVFILSIWTRTFGL